MSRVAEVRLWGRSIGAVSLGSIGGVAAFEYDRAFQRSGIELSPLMMPLGPTVYRFGGLARDTFHGLPGMLADSLPDRFGNAVINAWLATRGRVGGEIDAVERLCYTGTRGMGALEFWPTAGPQATETTAVDVAELVTLASEVLTQRGQLEASLANPEREASLREILRVGASAGGARAKAVIAWNPETHDVRSGQLEAPPGFESWLLKFDGVSNNRDRELADPVGYGAIEYAYSLMARAAGITMTPCRLLEENGRRHFMTRRFDRTASGGKVHMQTLAGLAHLDFNRPATTSYEQVFSVIRRLQLPRDDIEQQYLRMAFNVVGRNHDDHVKNIAFLMDRTGRWSLSPAYDVTYSYNPEGAWTAKHQMSLNEKRDGFSLEDFRHMGRVASLKRGRDDDLLNQVVAAVRRWPHFANQAGVPEPIAATIARTHRLEWMV